MVLRKQMSQRIRTSRCVYNSYQYGKSLRDIGRMYLHAIAAVCNRYPSTRRDLLYTLRRSTIRPLIRVQPTTSTKYIQRDIRSITNLRSYRTDNVERWSCKSISTQSVLAAVGSRYRYAVVAAACCSHACRRRSIAPQISKTAHIACDIGVQTH